MESRGNSTDEFLVEKLSQGDRSAFEEIYLKYWGKLYSAVYKRVRNAEVAEEIVQDFFVYLWEKRKTFVIHTSFEAYIHTAIGLQLKKWLTGVMQKTMQKLQKKQ